MDAKKLRLIKSKVVGFKVNMDNATAKQKADPVSVALAENFNALLGEIAAELPAVASSLPKPVPIGGLNWDMQLADIDYLGLEILTDQVLVVLDVVEE